MIRHHRDDGAPKALSRPEGVGMAVEAFGIEKEFLRDLLAEAAAGRSKLPEFQRGWVWPMENIR